ncbi:hypothetical protein [Pelagicoccus mobilis]|uniref:STAS/SEC14 domain-containing protein n=1 Tax=Pelagicoccus mobilis TaxID=415221 RepID=A0A934VUE3_9BACT|nr:hypothetical protein [Pelagicoccus mobilis]MBK1880643.1 hypothetical protein [Pelagicoccus mobilis]
MLTSCTLHPSGPMTPQTYVLPFGKYTAFQNVLIGEPVESVNMGIPQARQIIDEIARRFEGKWSYIGNRINRHSVDPMVYIFAKQEAPGFHSMAVVSYSSYTEKFAKIEREIANSVNLDFETFNDLEAAQSWTQQRLALANATETTA